ncbi:MAG: hypothetical protein LKE88_01510 [Acidaminococcus provencensis]|uniref:hypothetical protein n=1 Tax=Acidaminococcus provencensis TaxID=2058289 RepID=UPI0022E8D739|nr:hypothetical protein [Acidaminococcus provencensis]MCH4095315.1 hypothetical protein [Acidaminococcus provencensis]
MKKKIVGKVRYVGPDLGVTLLKSNVIYDVVGIEPPFIRVIDESEEDYLYYMLRPQSLDKEGLYGKFEIVEDEDGLLAEAMARQEKIKKEYLKTHPPLVREEK